MQAGQLRDTIQIEQPVITIDDFGSQIETYEYYLTTKSQVIYSAGNRNITNLSSTKT
ncbi:MAG: hypothetical protein LBV69_05895 [Bacteroidales bacterium]|jgi:head-tail adaptor|nr:hypothetical protein [Bacteroidales bacterium]